MAGWIADGKDTEMGFAGVTGRSRDAEQAFSESTTSSGKMAAMVSSSSSRSSAI